MSATHAGGAAALAPFLVREHILNGSNASRLPKMLYGTAWKREHTPHLVIKAIQNGFRAIDTAAQPKHYEEAFVGDAIRAIVREGFVKREQLFVSLAPALAPAPASARIDGRTLTAYNRFRPSLHLHQDRVTWHHTTLKLL
jgi:hypothetical protein